MNAQNIQDIYICFITRTNTFVFKDIETNIWIYYMMQTFVSTALEIERLSV